MQQVVRRISEGVNLGGSAHKEKREEPKDPHFYGPVPVQCRHNCLGQFKQIRRNGLFFSIEIGNNCVQINDSFYLIRNIIVLRKYDDPCVVVERFVRKSDFFVIGNQRENIMKSSTLGIWMVSHLSGIFEIYEITTVRKKYVQLPYKGDKFILIPLGACY